MLNLNNLTGRSLLSRSWPSRSGLYSFSLLGFVCLNRSFWFYRSFSWQLCFLHFSEVSIFSRLKKILSNCRLQVSCKLRREDHMFNCECNQLDLCIFKLDSTSFKHSFSANPARDLATHNRASLSHF